MNKARVPRFFKGCGVPLAVTAGCFLGLSGKATGQTIAGHVVDSVTGSPIHGAFVLALDESGAEVDRALTTSTGAYELDGKSVAFVLRVERAGIATTDLKIDDMSVSASASVELRTASRPVVLSRVRSVANRCYQDPNDNAGTRLLWREARKVLSAIDWSERLSNYEYDATEYERAIDVEGSIIGEVTETVVGANIAPHLVSPTSSVRSNAEWFLSKEFSTANCFSVERPTGSREIGLAFAQVGQLPGGGASGALWFNPETAVLTSATLSSGNTAATASLRFARFTDGGWAITAWQSSAPAFDDTSAAHPKGLTQTGGRLTAVRAGGLTIYEDRRVTLVTGTVYDSTDGNVLPNAVVTLSGTEHWTTTDRSGAFFLAGDFDGTYSIVFGHPRLDSLGFIAPALSLDLELGATRTVNLGVPPLRSVLASMCPNVVLTPSRRVLFGVVRDTSGQPFAGANVSAYWQTIPPDLRGFGVDDQEAGGTTSELGTFALCGLTVGREVVVRARAGDLLSDFVPVMFDSQSFNAGDEKIAGDRGVARLDFTLRSPVEWEASVQGRVVSDGTLEPIDGAEVMVAGTPHTAVTDATGYFAIGNLPVGAHRITARRVGFRQVRHDVVLAPRETLFLSENALKMPTGVTELAPIVVEAEGIVLSQRHLVNSGFFDRRQAGLGDFATREEIEEWNPTETTDALRHMRGIRVVPNPAYGFSGDARRFLVGSTRTASLSQGSFCPALIYLDGVFAGSGADANIDLNTMMSVNLIEAIEVYSGPSETPPRFNRPGSNCGTIVIWTR